jgi:hypothetical protein
VPSADRCRFERLDLVETKLDNGWGDAVPSSELLDGQVAPRTEGDQAQQLALEPNTAEPLCPGDPMGMMLIGHAEIAPRSRRGIHGRDRHSCGDKLLLVALHPRSDLVEEITRLVETKGWREKPMPELSAIRRTRAVARHLQTEAGPDEAVVEALRWAANQLAGSDWQTAATLCLGLTDSTRKISMTDRAEKAGMAFGLSRRWFLAARAEWSSRNGPAKILNEVAEVLARDAAIDAGGVILHDEDGGWGWSSTEPPRDTFRQWPSQGGEQIVSLGLEAWQVIWSRSYLAIDDNDVRRQHYFWTARLRAQVDGLVSYRKPFGWTGSGEHERVVVHTPGAEWLGLRLGIGGDAKSRWSYHLFHLGGPGRRGDEIVLSYSETWIDRQYFFSPFLRIVTANDHQDYLEVAVRLPEALKPSGLSEMVWDPDDAPGEDAITGPRRVREVKHYVPGTWYGLHVPHPIPGKSYGLAWRSAVYDGITETLDTST